VEAGYSSAWQLLRVLLKHQQGRSKPLSIVEQGVAALEHLCLQFQRLVMDRIRQSQVTLLSHRYKNVVANQCATFCELALNQQQQQSPWPIMFYCLRCGDAGAALEVYQQSTQPHSAVLQVLSALNNQQGRNAQTIWSPPAASRHAALQVSATDRRAVGHLWESCQHRDPSADMHEQGVYALLSGVALLPTAEGNAHPGFSTMEDYLTGAIWKALLHQDPSSELDALGRGIKELGAEHFGDSSAGGWAFALPLMLTQQCSRALLHLTEAGGSNGILQATHIAYVLNSAGLVIRDDTGTPSTLDSSSLITENLVTSLLVTHAQQLLSNNNFGPRGALEYLARIPNRRRARQEIAKLIVSTGELSQLVGTINVDGVRIKGNSTIDMHFSPNEITILLGEAAELLLRGEQQESKNTDSRSTGLAAMCYMLAERYSDVLSLLNQLLCPPDKPDEQRLFWLGQVEEFRSNFLSKRTHVVQVLEQQGNLSLVETSRTLVELNAFFVRHREGRSEEAWQIVEGLQLLPTSETDLTVKEMSYQQRDSLVKACFPAVLQASMEMLHQEHRRLKLELRANTEEVVRERLRQLQVRANLIATLAGQVGLAKEHLEKILRLQSLLI